MKAFCKASVCLYGNKVIFGVFYSLQIGCALYTTPMASSYKEATSIYY